MDCSEREVSLVFVSDAKMREMNSQFRGLDKTTDVLSFPADEGQAIGAEVGELGDIVISAECAARQAASFGATFEEELDRLMVHGVLHLLGHDHHEAGETRRMKAAEKRLLTLLARER